MAINFEKPVRTKSGKQVVMFPRSTEEGLRALLVGVVVEEFCNTGPHGWGLDGEHLWSVSADQPRSWHQSQDRSLDLENVPEKAAFDPTKPVRTREGQAARVLAVNGDGDFPIVALVTLRCDGDTVMRYTVEGSRWQKFKEPEITDPWDLVNV